MISISTFLAIGGVTLGVAALTIVMSVTGGFQEAVSGEGSGGERARARAQVLDRFSRIPRRDGQGRARAARRRIGPFVINPMMVTHDAHTATGSSSRVDPDRMPRSLIFPSTLLGKLRGLRKSGSKPPISFPSELVPFRIPWRRRGRHGANGWRRRSAARCNTP